MQGQQNIQAVIRVRPLLPHEYKRGDQSLVDCLDDNATIQIFEDEKTAKARKDTVHAKMNASAKELRADHRTSMRFDSCFGPQATTEDLFCRSGIQNIVDSVCNGFAATVFAYGQTGAGKTHSLLGDESRKLVANRTGIIALATDAIMTQTAQNEGSSVHCTFSEIYAERVYDLLAPCKPPQHLRVRSGASSSFYVEGLAERPASSVQQVMTMVGNGLSNARVGAHALNAESNRSHRLLTLHVQTMDETGATRYGKLVLVDLAGSEDVRSTGSAGVMLKEASHINTSLFTLGKVIAAMARKEQGRRGGQKLVPYRDSVLTKLLADSLGGTSLCLILACVSPSSKHVEETQRTLAFACRARSIKNEPVIVMDPQDKLIADLKAEIQMLRTENAKLRDTQPFSHSVSEPDKSASKMYESDMGSSPTTAGGASGYGGDQYGGGGGGDRFERALMDLQITTEDPSRNSSSAVGDAAIRNLHISTGPKPGAGKGQCALLSEFDSSAYSLDMLAPNLGSTPDGRPESPYSALKQLGSPHGFSHGDIVNLPSTKPRKPKAASQTLPTSAPEYAPYMDSAAKKPPRRRQNSIGAGKKKPRSASAHRTRRKSAAKPSDWAQALAANAASEWSKPKATGTKKGKRPAKQHVSLDVAGSIGGNDPKAFDDWEARMLQNWEAAYSEVLNDFKPDADESKVRKRMSRLPNSQNSRKSKQDKLKNSRYDESGGGGWNSSVDLSFANNSASKASNDEFDPDAELKKMKKEILLKQLEQQRNTEERKRNKMRGYNLR